jgi:hypothetical protein
MKHLLLAVSLFLSANVFASAAGKLDGNTYCRTVQSGGFFGQPKGERSHCVAFKGGFMTDNANTFFGNPPETLPYKVRGTAVVVYSKHIWQQAYKLVGETLENSAGAVLTIQ